MVKTLKWHWKVKAEIQQEDFQRDKAVEETEVSCAPARGQQGQDEEM